MMMSSLLLLLAVALLLPLATAPPVLVANAYEANVKHFSAILKCLKDGSKSNEEREKAAKELKTLSSRYEFERLVDAGGMEILAQLIDSSDKTLRADAIFILTKMVAESPTLSDQLISRIKISHIEQMLLQRNDLSADESAMLNKIIELVMPKIGDPMECSALKDNNNYTNLVQKAILNDSEVILRENLHWLIKKSGHLANLVKCLGNDKESIFERQRAASALFNISSGLSELDEDVLKAGLLNAFKQIHNMEDEDKETAKLKSYASRIMANLAHRRLATVLECLKNGTKSDEVRRKAADELAAISALNPLHLNIVDAGGAEILDKLLYSSDKTLRADAIFALHNLFAEFDAIMRIVKSKIEISRFEQLLREGNDLSGDEKKMLRQIIDYYKTK